MQFSPRFVFYIYLGKFSAYLVGLFLMQGNICNRKVAFCGVFWASTLQEMVLLRGI